MNEVKYTTPEEIQQLKKEIRVEKLKGKYTGESELSISIVGQTGIRTVLSRVIFILITVFLSLILISIIVAKNTGKTPNVLGYQIYRVETGSMAPTLPAGSIIVVRSVKEPENLEVGTIVTYVEDGYTITHRIIEVVYTEQGVSYRTKGDNPQNSPDRQLLSPDRIKGVFVFKVPLV